MADTDVLRETDGAARDLSRGLVRGARFAALATLEPGTGVPLASRVNVATDVAGAPVILISRLSAHFGALVADPRCSLLMGEPGDGDPLAHPRVTLVCTAAMAEGEARAPLRERFLRYHPKAALYADFGDFAFWRLEPERAALNGGFGKAYALDVGDIMPPAPAGLAEMEPGAVAHLNADHRDALALCAGEPGDWTVQGLDANGLDLDCAGRMRRVPFTPALADASEWRARLRDMASIARGNGG